MTLFRKTSKSSDECQCPAILLDVDSAAANVQGLFVWWIMAQGKNPFTPLPTTLGFGGLAVACLAPEAVRCQTGEVRSVSVVCAMWINLARTTRLELLSPDLPGRKGRWVVSCSFVRESAKADYQHSIDTTYQSCFPRR